MMPSGLSIKRYQPRPAARLRLFCFPWAGVGASAFFRWSEHLPAEVELAAVQYPGREERLREPPLRRLQPLVEHVAADVRTHLDLPYAFWGHSMGALVAFELARLLRATGEGGPAHLFVSGRQAPGVPDPVEPIGDLPDAEFVRELQLRYGGVPDVVARDPELRALFLPAIRADLELVYTHQHQPGPPLACPISAFGGRDDRVTRDHLDAWRRQTTAGFRLERFPGDHFYLTAQAPALLACVLADLRAAGLVQG